MGIRPICYGLLALSGSGKSTLANLVEMALHKKGLSTYILDGDNVRQGINKDLSFAPQGPLREYTPHCRDF